MSTPTRMPAPKRREQLLHIAGQLFANEGYHPVSMDQIAAAAGVSKPVLYQHFASKRALYGALMEEAAAEVNRLIEAALTATEDNRERVHGAISAFFGFADDPRFRLLYLTADSAESEVADLLEASHAQVGDSVARLIMADADLDGSVAAMLAGGIRGAAVTGAQWWVRHRDGDTQLPREDAVEWMVRLVWRGLAGMESPEEEP